MIDQTGILGPGSGVHLPQQGGHVPAAGGGQCCCNPDSCVPGLQGGGAAVDPAWPLPDSQCCWPGIRALLQGVAMSVLKATSYAHHALQDSEGVLESKCKLSSTTKWLCCSFESLRTLCAW